MIRIRLSVVRCSWSDAHCAADIPRRTDSLSSSYQKDRATLPATDYGLRTYGHPMLGPIFMREFQTVPRRGAHYLARTASLGLLWVIGVTAWQAAVGWHRSALLGETARFGLMLFQIFTYVLLTLLLFFAALSAPSPVAQEKDPPTFILLLLPALRDSQFVLAQLLVTLLPTRLLFAVSLPF